MEKIYQKEVIEENMKKSRLSGQFRTEGLDFAVIHYQQGEFLSTPQQPITHFQFLIKGSVTLYYLDEHGNRRNVATMERHGLLGDMEFVLGNLPVFYVEAISPATVLALPMEANRAKLEKDCEFLMYLLRNASQIKVLSTRNQVVLPHLEERLLYHLAYECPHQTITGMESSAVKLHCSRRQLQRVVKKLEAQGILIKLKKGCYRLFKRIPDKNLRTP